MSASPWLWIPLALLLFAASAYSLARYIIGDRPRARRRCPKCGYDLAGIPDACPECGRKIRSQRELSRTRRHKRWAVAGIALGILGSGCLATRQAMARGAMSLVPDWILLAGVGEWQTGVLETELRRRHREGELSTKEQRYLITRAIRLLTESEDPTVLARAASIVYVSEQLGRLEAERHTKPWESWVRASTIEDARSLVRALDPLVMHAHPDVSLCAATALIALGSEKLIVFPSAYMVALQDPTHAGAVRVADGLVSTAPDPYGEVRRLLARFQVEVSPGITSMLSTLSEVRHDDGQMRARLRLELENGSDEARLVAMWIVRSAFWPDDELRRIALSKYDPAAKLTAPATVDFAVSGPLDEAAIDVLRRALGTWDYEQWAWAVERLGDRGEDADALAPDIQKALGTERALISAHPYAQITGDREAAARALIELARSHDAFRNATTIRMLARIGCVGEEVVEFWRESLVSGNAYSRLAAAGALLRSGPPPGFDRASLTRIGAESCIEQFGYLHGAYFGETIRYGEADIPTVLAILDEHPDLDRSLTVWLLGMAGTKAEAALPWLERALNDPDADVASNAALSIRRINWCLKHGDPPPEPRDRY